MSWDISKLELSVESLFPSLGAFPRPLKKNSTVAAAEANTGSSCNFLLLFLHPVMAIANSLYENSIKEKGRVGKKMTPYESIQEIATGSRSLPFRRLI